jgi:hypothetical protein
MTITSTQNRVSYAGNGAPGVPGTLAFSVPFRFLAISDLVVLVRVDATGADTTKTLDTHYSVSGEGAATGGTVTFLIEDGEPQTGETLIIYGNPAMTQLVDYIAGGVFPAESHEEALDRLTLQSTRSRELVERTPRLMEGDTDGSGQYDANSNRISNLGTPTATTDATTKTYVDALVNNTALGPAPTGLIATGSITSRLLADRWGEVKNVKDYGATGDGVTDDTAAINAAIAATPDWATIVFPAAGYGYHYRLTGTIDLRKKIVDARSAEFKLDHAGIGLILGSISSQGFGPSQHVFRVTRLAGESSVPEVQVKGSKGQHITVDYVDFIQFYSDADDSITGGAASQAYSTFTIRYANRIELNANPSPSGGLAQYTNDCKFNINRTRVIVLDGTYGHNNNRFTGCTLEGSYVEGVTDWPLIDIRIGSANYFRDIRAEGTIGVKFARGVSDCLIEQSYVPAPHFFDPVTAFTITNYGENCGVRHEINKQMPLVNLAGIDHAAFVEGHTTDLTNLTSTGTSMLAGAWAIFYTTPTFDCPHDEVQVKWDVNMLTSKGMRGNLSAYDASGAEITRPTAGTLTATSGTINTGADTITLAAPHGFSAGDGPIQFTTSGTLPAGLGLNTDYWVTVVNATTISLLNAPSGGSTVDITSGGSGTHTVEIHDIKWDGSAIKQFGTQSNSSNNVGSGGFYIINTLSVRAKLWLSAGGSGAEFDVLTVSARCLDLTTKQRISTAFGTPLGQTQTVVSTITALADDATPTVAGGSTFTTGGTTTITDFDDGVLGQTITILSEHAITITDGTNIILHGSANFVMAASDSLTLVLKADNKWYETARMVN